MSTVKLSNLNNSLSFLPQKNQEEFQKAFIEIDTYYFENEKNLSSEKKAVYLRFEKQIQELKEICEKLNENCSGKENLDIKDAENIEMTELALNVLKTGCQDVLGMPQTQPHENMNLLGKIFKGLNFENLLKESVLDVDEFDSAQQFFLEGYEKFTSGEKTVEFALGLAESWKIIEEDALTIEEVCMPILKIAGAPQGREYFDFIASQSAPFQ